MGSKESWSASAWGQQDWQSGETAWREKEQVAAVAEPEGVVSNEDLQQQVAVMNRNIASAMKRVIADIAEIKKTQAVVFTPRSTRTNCIVR